MKKLVISLLVLSAVCVVAQMTIRSPFYSAALSPSATNAPPTGCTSMYYSNSVAADDYSTPGLHWVGVGSFDPASFGAGNPNVCSVTFYLDLPNTNDYVASIWVMSGDNLDTQLGSESSPVAGPGSDALVTFEFGSSITMTNGVVHAICIRRQDNEDFIGVGKLHQGGNTLTYYTGRWASDKTRTDYSTRDPVIIITTP